MKIYHPPPPIQVSPAFVRRLGPHLTDAGILGPHADLATIVRCLVSRPLPPVSAVERDHGTI